MDAIVTFFPHIGQSTLDVGFRLLLSEPFFSFVSWIFVAIACFSSGVLEACFADILSFVDCGLFFPFRDADNFALCASDCGTPFHPRLS